MTSKQFGIQETTKARDYASEVNAIAQGVPHQLVIDRDGDLIGFSYETTWKSGGTTPVLDDNDEVVDYKEKYKNEKLSAAQIKKLDEWAKENVKTK